MGFIVPSHLLRLLLSSQERGIKRESGEYLMYNSGAVPATVS